MVDCLLEEDVFEMDLENRYEVWLKYSCACNPSWDDCECLSFNEWLDLVEKENESLLEI